jgi:hypothetical protein
MNRTFWLLAFILTCNAGLTASEGKTAERQSNVAAPAARGHESGSGPLAYAVVSNGPGAPTTGFGILDIGSGQFHAIAELPGSAQGIARDAQGKVYIIDGNNNLERVNLGNGKLTLIGNTGVTTGSPLGPVKVDVFAALATGELFLMDYSNNLYSVNPDTGAATLIGPTGIPPIISPLYASSLSGDCTNLFFTIDEADQNFNPLVPPTLYRIDPRTAAATLVGPTEGLMPGSGFLDGSLYGFRIDEKLLFGGTRLPKVFRIDTATGAAIAIADLNVPLVGGAVSTNNGGVGHCKAERK